MLTCILKFSGGTTEKQMLFAVVCLCCYYHCLLGICNISLMPYFSGWISTLRLPCDVYRHRGECEGAGKLAEILECHWTQFGREWAFPLQVGNPWGVAFCHVWLGVKWIVLWLSRIYNNLMAFYFLWWGLACTCVKSLKSIDGFCFFF